MKKMMFRHIVFAMILAAHAEPVAHWKLDETDQATDFMGDRIDSGANGIDLPLSGNASQGGRWAGGTAMLVTGASTSYRSGSAVAARISGSFSFSMFVDPYATDSGAYLLQLTDGFEVRLKSFSGGALFDMIVKTATETPYVRSAYLNGGNKEPAGGGNEVEHMYHLAGTYNAASGELALYLDGIKTTKASSGGALRNPGTFYLGQTASQPSLVGLYDDIQLYDEALSDSQIAFLRTHPGSSIQSGNSYHWNAESGVWNTPQNWAGGSVPSPSALVFATNGTIRLDSDETIDFLALDNCKLELVAGGLATASDVEAGTIQGSTVEILQTNGLFDIGGNLSLCHDTPPSMNTAYSMSGGSLHVAGKVEVGGCNNNGTFIQTGGGVAVDGSFSCGRDGGFGVFGISGGSLAVRGFTAIKDGEFRVMGSAIGHIEMDRLDMENEAYSIFVAGIDQGGVTPVDIVGSYLKLDGARIRVEPMEGYAGHFGDTFDIFRIPATKTIKLANTEVESTMGQQFTASITTVGTSKVIRLTVASHALPRTLFRFLPQTGSLVACERGHGFNDFLCKRFNGTNCFQASEPVDTLDAPPTARRPSELLVQLSSNAPPIRTPDPHYSDSFTLEAWFNADSVSGTQTLLSNTDNAGFSLKIVDGQLEGTVYLRNGTNNLASPVAVRGGNLSPGIWYHAAFVVREDKPTRRYGMELYLDETLVATNSAATGNGIAQSALFPMVGAQPSPANQPTSGFFEGLIHAATLANYAKSKFFLESKCTRDGSSYLGLSREHDYLSPVKGFDLRIDETVAAYPDVAKITDRFVVPLIDDAYVPQAVAVNGSNRVYVSCFWYDTDLSKHRYPSVLAELTPRGRLRRVMPLFMADGSDFTWHSGGIAYFDGHIYISSGHDICRFTPDTSDAGIIDPDTLAHIKYDETPLTNDALYTIADLGPNSAMSGLSMSYDSDGTPLLWSMQFSRNSHRHIIALEISPDGSVDPGQSPRYTFELPVFNAQGIVCRQVDATQVRFYLSQSSGDHPSHLYDVLYNKDSPAAVSTVTVATLPAGMEGIDLMGGKIWSVSESGSKVFQKRTEDYWRQLFPFVFALPAN